MTPVRVYTAKNEKLHLVTPMYTREASGGPLVLLIRSTLRPQIAHSDAHESMYGKPSRITHSDARESIHEKPSTIAHSDGREYTRRAIENCT